MALVGYQHLVTGQLLGPLKRSTRCLTHRKFEQNDGGTLVGISGLVRLRVNVIGHGSGWLPAPCHRTAARAAETLNTLSDAP
jgi:hypothetical protein